MSNFPRKVNVPEKFYEVMLSGLSFNKFSQSPRDTLLTKLSKTEPTSRGRGQSRWLKGDDAVTEAEWNALYELAAEFRKKMQGAEDREHTLRAAICARALAERMEKIGVDNPVTYTPKFRVTRTRTETPEEPVTSNTDLSSTIPPVPPVVDQTSDVEEANDEDLGYIHNELDVG